MESTKPFLSFSTNPPGMPIRIDGEPYEIKHRHKLTLRAAQWFDAVMPRLAALVQIEERSEAEEAELDAILEKATPLVVDVSSDVLAKLGQVQRTQIVNAHCFISFPAPGA